MQLVVPVCITGQVGAESWDFKVVSSTLARYGRGRVPEDSTVEDWPISYDDLEPFYDKVEYTVGVSGRAGMYRV